MFALRFYSTMRFACYAGLNKSGEQARFWSVNSVTFTKSICSTSNLESAKQDKITKNKKNNNKVVEKSKLYPDEWEKLSKFDAIEHFSFFNDDFKTSSVKGKSKSDQPLNLKNELKSVKSLEEEESLHETGKMKDDKLDFPEFLSDSDSESGSSDTENNGRFFNENNEEKVKSDETPKNETKHFSEKKIYSDLIVQRLPRRSTLLSSEMKQAYLAKEMTAIQNFESVFHFAKLGILPKKIFCVNIAPLQSIASYLSSVDVYQITSQDYKYWANKGPGLGLLALYQIQELKKPMLREPEIPISVICTGMKNYQTLGLIIHTLSACPPKTFITTEDCTSPWNSEVLRISGGRIVDMNYNYHLSWEEIQEKIDESDRIVLVDVESVSNVEMNKIRSQSKYQSIPCVDLYSHNFWDQGDITMVVLGNYISKNVDNIENAIDFCRERNALLIKVKKRLHPSAAFNMVFFELRRKWLEMNKKARAGNYENNEKPFEFQTDTVEDCSEITNR